MESLILVTRESAIRADENSLLAADISFLQTASNFVVPVATANDPRADYAFIAAVTAFCNNAFLFVPLPRDAAGEKPFLFELWSASRAVKEVPRLELTDAAYSGIAHALIDGFMTFVEGTATDVAQWTAFQFSPEINRQYITRADIEPMRRVAQITHDLITNNRIRSLRAALECQGFREPAAFTGLLGSTDFPSLLHLSVSYVLSVYLRGWSYAAGLSQLQERPVYQHHWLRARALRTDVGLQPERIQQTGPVLGFPWGIILQAAFDPAKPLTDRDPRRLRDVLFGLRERSAEFRASLRSVHDQRQGPGLTDAERLVIDELCAVDLFPRYANTSRAERLAKWLRHLGSVGPAWSKLAAELISTTFQAGWLRAIETAFRMQFRTSNFWDVFKDPGIREALRNTPSVEA